MLFSYVLEWTWTRQRDCVCGGVLGLAEQVPQVLLEVLKEDLFLHVSQTCFYLSFTLIPVNSPGF